MRRGREEDGCFCSEESMSYNYVSYEKAGEIARITMNKPEKLNAYAFISVAVPRLAATMHHAGDEKTS